MSTSSDFDNVRKRLFDEAVRVVKSKEQSYVRSLGVTLVPVGLASEKYDAFYPSDTYERYQAYETGSGYVYSNTGSSTVTQRKSFTFFYEPFEASRFDAVLHKGSNRSPVFSLPAMPYDTQKLDRTSRTDMVGALYLVLRFGV